MWLCDICSPTGELSTHLEAGMTEEEYEIVCTHADGCCTELHKDPDLGSELRDCHICGYAEFCSRWLEEAEITEIGEAWEKFQADLRDLTEDVWIGVYDVTWAWYALMTTRGEGVGVWDGRFDWVDDLEIGWGLIAAEIELPSCLAESYAALELIEERWST